MSRAGLALLVAVALAACSGGEDRDGVASIGEADGTDDGAAAADDGELSDAERDDAMLEFAACMREHGVDMPDPDVSGSGGGRIVMNTEMGSPEEIEAAQEACSDILEDVRGNAPQRSPEEEAEMRDNMLAFAECMRDHGIDMPDPEFDSDGGVRMRVGEGGVDPNSEEFEAAQKACEDELGFEGGPGGGPGAGATTGGDES